MKDRSIAYAFARGYYDGRSIGVESNPYDGQSDPQFHIAYRDGYEWGISDYCRENHPEDEAA